jgi:hypothetical protein
MFPITFMTVRHGVHVSLFALLFIAFVMFFKDKNSYFRFEDNNDLIIFLCFCGLILAVLFGQLFRLKIHMAAFDGPSRIAFAGLVFLLLKSRQIAYIKILEVAIPVGLLCVLSSVTLNPAFHWGDRFANYFVDPNTLVAFIAKDNGWCGRNIRLDLFWFARCLVGGAVYFFTVPTNLLR